MLQLLGSRVLILLPPRASEQEGTVGYGYQPKGETPAGIVLAKPTDAYDIEVATRGIVVQIGEVPHGDVAPGDCVIFPPNVGERITREGLDYLIVDEGELLGVLEPAGTEREWLERLETVVARALHAEVPV